MSEGRAATAVVTTTGTAAGRNGWPPSSLRSELNGAMRDVEFHLEGGRSSVITAHLQEKLRAAEVELSIQSEGQSVGGGATMPSGCKQRQQIENSTKF